MSLAERSVQRILNDLVEQEGDFPAGADLEDLVDMCQARDARLRRQKRRVLSDIVLKVSAKLQRDEEPMMVVPEEESNSMNQSVVGMWKTPSAEPQSQDETTGKEKEKEKEKEKPKRKKRRTERRPMSTVTLDDIGGIDGIIQQLLELIAMPLSHPEIYQQLGSDIPRGVLLHGPPGCGKTMLANAVANELGVAFISISAPSVVSGMSGESEKKLRDIFAEAKELAPCLVFIDEIDAITPKRETVQREMERRIVAQLLTCMDDVSLERTDGKPVMVIGATNRPDSLDPALRRGGRFDHEICMSVPDQDARERILATMSRRLRLEGSMNFKEIAKRTAGFVGADINALVAAAGVGAIKRIFGEMNVVQKEAPGSLIAQFLAQHQERLTPEQLEPLSIQEQDFLNAIPNVQPSSRREGFATVPDVTWDNVGAMKPIREELEYAIVEPIRRPEIYQAAGIGAPSGVLLWGPPGCGKTLLAKAVANESRANFISVRGPELLNKYVGESERAVRQVFVRARASVPCVIFFDELDALVPRRDDANSEASSRVVNTLLTELDGVGDRQGVFVVAATNRPDIIDAAMLRPGRLDKQLFVELPNSSERSEILYTVAKSTPLYGVDLSAVARDERCRNFSGADLAALVREASVLALRDVLKGDASEIRVMPLHFERAFGKVRPSVSDTERQRYYAMRERLAS